MSQKASRHFLHQRLTAIANIPLAGVIAYALLLHADSHHAAAKNFFSQPIMTAILLLFLTSAVYHMRLGMEVVMDDYIHGRRLRPLAGAANIAFALSVWILGVLAALTLLAS